MANNLVSYPPDPAHVHRVAAQGDMARVWHLVLLIAGTAVFVASAAALVVPSLARAVWAPATLAGVVSPATATSAASAAPTLTAAGVERVLAYARSVRPDDSLVQVRPGVFAKRSNVYGVEVGGRTVYYDIQPHQSFGPLRSGALAESDVIILARATIDSTQILIYVPKR